MVIVYFLVSIFLINQISPTKDIHKLETKHNLYIKEDQGFIRNIERAIKSYNTEKKQCRGCSCYENVIEENLYPFKGGITVEMIDSSSAKRVKYQVIHKKVYRSKECMFPARCEGVDYFLNHIRNDLPDVEFIVNFHDWPQISRHFNKPLPVFSFSKTSDYFDILYPAWSFWKGGPAIKIYPTGIGRWDKHREEIAEITNKWPWEQKSSIAFFRGSRTSSERDNLILLSRREPELVNASYTKNQAWKSDKDTLGYPPSEEVLLEDHCQYRYLFNFRGVAASFRLKYLFLCKSLVLHVGDQWKEFYYDSLKPWIHYVPVPSHYSQEQYRHLLEFLREEDKLSKEIAMRGYEFIYNNLRIEDIICYWKKLLLKYKSLLNFTPKLDSSLINVSA